MRSVRNQVGKSILFEVQDGTIQLIHPETGTYFVELISNGQITIQAVFIFHFVPIKKG